MDFSKTEYGMVVAPHPETADAGLEILKAGGNAFDAIVAADPTFIYGVASLGVTGEREALSESITSLASRIRERSTVPIVAGVGISTPEQAASAEEVSSSMQQMSANIRQNATPSHLCLVTLRS